MSNFSNCISVATSVDHHHDTVGVTNSVGSSNITSNLFGHDFNQNSIIDGREQLINQLTKNVSKTCDVSEQSNCREVKNSFMDLPISNNNSSFNYNFATDMGNSITSLFALKGSPSDFDKGSSSLTMSQDCFHTDFDSNFYHNQGYGNNELLQLRNQATAYSRYSAFNPVEQSQTEHNDFNKQLLNMKTFNHPHFNSFLNPTSFHNSHHGYYGKPDIHQTFSGYAFTDTRLSRQNMPVSIPPPPTVLTNDKIISLPKNVLSPGQRSDSGISGISPKSNNSRDSKNCESEICRVCEVNICNGTHFSARTCSSCAAYFRRSISGQKTYACKKNSNCLPTISKTNGYNKICRHCRLERCYAAGMKAESVQKKRTDAIRIKATRLTEQSLTIQQARDFDRVDKYEASFSGHAISHHHRQNYLQNSNYNHFYGHHLQM